LEKTLWYEQTLRGYSKTEVAKPIDITTDQERASMANPAPQNSLPTMLLRKKYF
jgi:hypothetical protein